MPRVSHVHGRSTTQTWGFGARTLPRVRRSSAERRNDRKKRPCALDRGGLLVHDRRDVREGKLELAGMALVSLL